MSCSVARKLNFSIKVLLQNQTLPTKALFRIHKHLHWNHECLYKRLALKPTKFLLRNQTGPTKALFRIQKCLNECLEVKPNFSTKVLLLNQTPPTKSLFRIQNVWMNVLKWNRICQQKSCCKTKLHQQNPCFEFKMFEWKSCI